jgi:hypothetical protein
MGLPTPKAARKFLLPGKVLSRNPGKIASNERHETAQALQKCSTGERQGKEGIAISGRLMVCRTRNLYDPFWRREVTGE